MSKLRAAISAAAVVAAALGVSPIGKDLIASFEGKRNTAYADVAHGWKVTTICYGHTLTAKRGQYKSDEECLELLESDVQAHFDILRRSIVGTNVVLTQGEADAYTSLIYNIGGGNWLKSTALRQLKAGNKYAACDAILPWKMAGGVVLPGLVRRRAAERTICYSQLPARNLGTAIGTLPK